MNDFEVGEWTVRPTRDCIEREGECVHIKPKAMAVLCCLVRADGEVVTRQRLFDAVWPNSEVSDATLTQCIVELRHALGDDARHPQYIETIPRVGFRLLPPVTPLESDDPTLSGYATQDRAKLQAARPSAFTAAIIVITVFLLAAAWRWGSGPGEGEAASAPAEGTRTIVVLPFVDASPSQDQGWFADGLTAELITRLTRISQLRVIGQSSALSLKGQVLEIDQLSDLLGVQYVLEGSIFQAGDRIRITAKLVDVTSGFNLWSDTFEGAMDDLFAFQLEITRHITLALSVRLNVGDFEGLAGGTDNVEAFMLLMKAWDHHGEFTSEAVLKSIDLASQAVALDPAYARAWMALGLFYRHALWAVDPRVALDWQSLSNEAIEQAVSLAPDLPVIVAQQTNQLTQQDEWEAAEALFEQAGLDYSRMNTELAFQRALFLTQVGRVSEAIPVMEHVRVLEPLLSHPITVMAYLYLFAGRESEALAEYDLLWTHTGSMRRFWAMTGLSLAISTGRREWIEKWTERLEQVGELPEIEGFAELTRMALTNRTEALSWLRLRFESSDISDYNITLWALYLGDEELAIDAIRRSPDEWALWNPLTESIRDRPEYRQALRQVGLEDYWRRHSWSDFCRPRGLEDFECFAVHGGAKTKPAPGGVSR